ncbi:hypothetical protein J7E73_06750 [Paenibacillus albidus]|nr:hypothetical protein [Paenibacillus albidus]
MPLGVPNQKKETLKGLKPFKVNTRRFYEFTLEKLGICDVSSSGAPTGILITDIMTTTIGTT